MKKMSFWMFVLIFTGPAGFTQPVLDQLKKGVQEVKKTPLSNDEIVKGLREALTVGTNNSATAASKPDGYYKNPAIKIPFPPQARKMEETLKSMGMTRQVNEFVMTLNRAAEKAAKDAAPIFVDAIKNMTITDGLHILKGADNEATMYLKGQTEGQLKARFQPVIKNALASVQITKYWAPLMTRYNRIPGVQKMNPNLEEYVTARAITGLFHLIAQEELKIRKDPAARITELLKKVFG